MLSCSCRVSVRRWHHALPRHAARSVSGQQFLSGWDTVRRQLSTKLRVAERIPPEPHKRPPVIISPGPVLSKIPRKETTADRSTPRLADDQERTFGSAEKPRPAPSLSPQAVTAQSRWAQVRKMMSTTELRRLMREYGTIALALHTTVFVSTLGGFYVLVDYGVDVASILQRIPMLADNVPRPSAGTLAVAWAITTVTGPVRALITITLTPRLARFFWGRYDQRRLEAAQTQAKKEEDGQEEGSGKR